MRISLKVTLHLSSGVPDSRAILCFAVLRVEGRALCMLSQCHTTELPSLPWACLPGDPTSTREINALEF